MAKLDRVTRYEMIRQIARKFCTGESLDQYPPEHIGLAHYTDRQVRQDAKDIGLTDRYIETVGKEREG